MDLYTCHVIHSRLQKESCISVMLCCHVLSSHLVMINKSTTLIAHTEDCISYVLYSVVLFNMAK